MRYFVYLTLRTFGDACISGLRTLCIAVCELTEAAYAKWSVDFHRASTSIVDREKKVAAVAEGIEKVGCSHVF